MYKLQYGKMVLSVNPIHDRLVEIVLRHPRYANGKAIVVDKLSNYEEAIRESDVDDLFWKWVRILTKGELPTQLRDFSTVNTLASEMEAPGEPVIYAKD